MKIIKRFVIEKITLLLIGGNLFLDRALKARVITWKILSQNLKWFGLEQTAFRFPILNETFFVFFKDKCISRENFFQWWYIKGPLSRIYFKPLSHKDWVVIPVSDEIMEPSVISLAGKNYVLVSRGDHESGPRYEVTESFKKILKIAYDHDLSPIGCLPFAYKWAERGAVAGVIDAIRSFPASSEFEIRMYERNPKNEHCFFSPIESELKDMEVPL